MIDILDELTEIPFDVFWDKYQEISRGNYNKLKAKAIWFAIVEDQRKHAFTVLSLSESQDYILYSNLEPFEYLNLFNR